MLTLLSERGLHIDDFNEASGFLSRVSYYRLSGYFRHWQINPGRGDNRFIPGSSFSTIQNLYNDEQTLIMLLDEVLHPIEVLLRTQFAHHYAHRVEPTGVLEDLAESLKVSRKTLPSQVRSFVYLRNRVAHCAKLWNHSVLDNPGLSSTIANRAKRTYRSFSNHSIYRILVALDLIARNGGIADAWLSTKIEPILNDNPLLAAGIAQPAHFGDMDQTLLIP